MVKKIRGISKQIRPGIFKNISLPGMCWFIKPVSFSGKKIIPAGPIIRNKDEKENTHRIYTLIILSLDDSGNILSTS